ncbi:MAG: hypothetical protein OES32_08815 [Acidobacteriota bacterium]|nr:hypothetical protein [Acidobacteriota bacterium]
MKTTRILLPALRFVARRPRPAVAALTLWLVAPLTASPGVMAFAQGGTSRSSGLPSRLEILPMLRTVEHSNFFQVSEDLGPEDVREDEARIRVRYRVTEDRRVRVYGELGISQYDSRRLDNAPRRRVGVMSGGPRHAFDSSLAFVSNGREVELTDAVRASDIWNWVGLYDYWLTEAWQVGVRAVLWQQEFDDDTARVDTNEIGVRARYRGFGRIFSPEVGLLRRQSSDAVGRNDYDEDLSYVRLHFSPTPRVGFSLRYRFRDRAFSTTDPTISNFGRSDERDKWTLLLSSQVWKNLDLRLIYDRIDGRSTDPTHVFDSQDLGLILAWRLGGG